MFLILLLLTFQTGREKMGIILENNLKVTKNVNTYQKLLITKMVNNKNCQ